MGSLIRSSPEIFEGIQRVRIFYFIIAMRDEIARMKQCDEEDSIETMMGVSICLKDVDEFLTEIPSFSIDEP